MKKKKILIIDDDKELVEEIKEMLDSGEYEFFTANDSIFALELVRKSKPDLVLMDLKMPYKSGFQVACELKQHNDTKHIPIIAMTGFYTEEDHATLMHFCGIRKCFKKPFNPHEVITEIKSVFSR